MFSRMKMIVILVSFSFVHQINARVSLSIVSKTSWTIRPDKTEKASLEDYISFITVINAV